MENNTTIQNNSDDIITLATDKIKEEFKNFTGDTKEKAVSSYVSTILQDFCKQDKRFAEVIYKFKRTLSDCCKDVMHGVGTHISDIDVYRSAVKFYFPNSEVTMNMTIDITGEAPSDDDILKEAEKPKPKPQKTKTVDNKPTTIKTTKADKTVEKRPKQDKPKTEKKNDNVNECIQLSLF